MRRIALVSENFGMGGLERITGIVGNSLGEKNSVYFYSMFSNENFYELGENFFYGDLNIRKGSRWLKLGMYLNMLDVFFCGEYNFFRYYRESIELLIKWIKEKKIDVVILSGSFMIAMASYLKNELDVEIIDWVHNNYYVYLNDYAKKYKTPYLKGIKSADAVVCLTKFDKSHFLNLNENTEMIYNPCSISTSKTSNLNCTNISFVGRIDYKHKGIDYLIEIAKLLPENWTITIAGSGEKEQVERLKRDIKLNKLQNTINYRGPLKGEKLKQHYLDSSIYLMTSRWEGFGLVLVEAMNFGLPIIAFSQSGSDEVLGNGKFGILVDNGNIKEMSEQIRKLTENIKLREEYQQKSLQRVKDFNLQDITAKWVELIESL